MMKKLLAMLLALLVCAAALPIHALALSTTVDMASDGIAQDAREEDAEDELSGYTIHSSLSVTGKRLQTAQPSRMVTRCNVTPLCSYYPT